jgi:hypothetical protein
VLLGIVELILTVSDQASVTKLIVAIAFTALAAFGGLFFILSEWKMMGKKSRNQISE